uniref:Uncharacterized protein n=1 Tax=Anguilla anguilla TaxID=7936 RepID=A0A0E9T1G8_ANGAN
MRTFAYRENNPFITAGSNGQLRERLSGLWLSSLLTFQSHIFIMNDL